MKQRPCWSTGYATYENQSFITVFAQALDPILSQMNPVHIFVPYFLYHPILHTNKTEDPVNARKTYGWAEIKIRSFSTTAIDGSRSASSADRARPNRCPTHPLNRRLGGPKSLGVYYLRPAVTFQITAVYQLRPELFRVRVLVASGGHVTGRSPRHLGLPQVPFPKRWCCANTKCKYNQSAMRVQRFSGGDMMHDHDADSEACLNRQILDNSVKRKAMEDLCERPQKLIHKELRNQ